jgi:hypothetical protein
MKHSFFAIVETATKKVIGMYQVIGYKPARFNDIKTMIIDNGNMSTTVAHLSTAKGDIEQAELMLETEVKKPNGPFSWGRMMNSNELIINKQ